MALLMKLPNVIVNKGKFVYRRRIPTDLRQHYPRTFFETRFRSQSEGTDLVAEHTALQSAFGRMVKDARNGDPEALGVPGMARYIERAWKNLDDPRTERERWDDMRREAEALVRSVVMTQGRNRDDDDTERRSIVADDLERRGADPLLHKAVISPDAPRPPVTLADAARIYQKERLGDHPKKSAKDTFKRVKRRLETSLGPLDDLPLTDLTREHARKVRDDLLNTTRNGGGQLSPSSVQREINSIKAIITVGIREHSLTGAAFNPFEGLSLPRSVTEGKDSEWEMRDPFPDDVLVAIRKRVMTRTRIPELRLIWRLLQTTGCRGAEITGLLREDVVIDHTWPHIWVRWNDERRIKTKTSVRPVPLLGDGLLAAREAMECNSGGIGSAPLFPRYAHENGADAVSQALMSHVRNETTDRRLVVYSLRHNVKSWLGRSRASERDENRILGHADASVGNRYYGGLEDRLQGSSEALRYALELAPKGCWEVYF